MPIVEGAAKAAEVTGKAAVGIGKTVGAASKDVAGAANNAANAGANMARSAGSGLNAGANGLNSLGNSIGNKASGLGANNSGIGNSNRGLNNNKPSLGGNKGINNNKPGLGGNKEINNNKGLGSNKGLGNELGKNDNNLHKKGNDNSLFNRRSPLSPKNYFQRVKQQKEKMQDRGEDATGILPYIKAIPLIVKIYISSLITFMVFIIFGVSTFAAMQNGGYIDDTVVSGAVSGVTGSIASATPIQISSPSTIASDYINNHVSDEYQDIAQNIGHNQTPTTIEGKPVSDEELLYNQKIADIAFRYKQLYNVDLDWILITVSNMYGFNTSGDFYEKNLGGYNSSDVANLDKTMSLDWDYDYEDIDGYYYLAYGDYTYDLQILAKNMVKKTTTQQCVSGTTVLETKEVYDVEDDKLDEEHPDYLVCKTGTYKAISEYKVDTEKFDEFLLEYLDSRLYGAGGTKTGHSGGGQSSPTTSGRYGWPLPAGATSCRSSLYGYRIHPITGKQQYHSGDDYPAATGTPVYAIGDGTVIAVNTGCVVGNMNCGGGAGNYVKIDHGNGVVSVYMHASSVLVTKGQHVSRGQEIMKVGTTGSSTGPHLHITIRLNGQLDEPGKYIGALPACR